MASLRAADEPPFARPGQEPVERAIDPGTGGVDDRGRLEFDRGSAVPPPADGLDPQPTVGQEPRGMVREDCELRGRLHDRRPDRLRGRLGRDPPRVDEQFNREPLRKQHLGVGIDGREGESSGIDLRHPRSAGPHEPMPRPTRSDREEIVESESDADRPTATAPAPAPPAGQRLQAHQPRGRRP